MVTSVRPTPVRLKKGLRGWLTALPFILPGHLSDALFVKNDILNLLKRSQFNICRKKYKMCKVNLYHQYGTSGRRPLRL